MSLGGGGGGEGGRGISKVNTECHMGCSFSNILSVFSEDLLVTFSLVSVL